MGAKCGRSFQSNLGRVSKYFIVFVLSFAAHHVGAAEFVVTTTSDDGAGSFRHAIEHANASAEADVITFAIPEQDVNYAPLLYIWTIRILSPLPPIQDEGLIIRGEGYQGIPRISISGGNSALEEDTHGIVVDASNVVLENISVIGFSGYGIVLGAGGAIQNIALHNVHTTGNGRGSLDNRCDDVAKYGGVLIRDHVRRALLDHHVAERNGCFGIRVGEVTGTRPSFVTVQNPTIGNNNGIGIALQATDSVVQGMREKDAAHIFDNTIQDVLVEQSRRISVKYISLKNKSIHEASLGIRDSHDIVVEGNNIQDVIYGGVRITDSENIEVAENAFVRTNPHAVYALGSNVFLRKNTFEELDQDGIVIEVRVEDGIVPTIARLEGNTFTGIHGNAIVNKHSCYQVEGGDIAGEVSGEGVAHQRPFLVELYLDGGVPFIPSAGEQVYIQGAGLALQELVPLDGHRYGTIDSTLNDVWSWPIAKTINRGTGLQRISVVTKRGYFEANVPVGVTHLCSEQFLDAFEQKTSLTDSTIVGAVQAFLKPAATSSRDRIEGDQEDRGASTTIPLAASVGSLGAQSETHYDLSQMMLPLLAVVSLLTFVTFLVSMFRSRIIIQAKHEATQSVDGLIHEGKENLVVATADASFSIPKLLRTCISLVRDRSIFFAIAQFSVNGMNYVFLVLLAGHLAPVELGTMNALLSMLFLAAIPTIIMQDFVTNQFSPLSNKESRSLIASTVVFYTKYIVLILGSVSLGVVLFSSFVFEALNLAYAYQFGLLLLANFLNYLLPIPRGVWQSRRYFYLLGAHLIGETFVKITAFFIYIQLFDAITAVLLAICTGYILSGLWLYGSLLRKKFLSLSSHGEQHLHITDWIKESFLKNGVYFLIVVVLFSVFYNIDMIFVNHVFTDISGEYSIAARIAQLVIFGGMSIATANLPLFHKYNTSSSLKVLYRPVTIVLAGIIAFFAIMYFAGDWLIITFFGQEFAGIRPMVMRLAIGASSVALATLLAYFLLTRNERGFIKWLAGIIALFFGGLFVVPMSSLEMFIGFLVLADILAFFVIALSFVRYVVAGSLEMSGNYIPAQTTR